MRMPTTCYVVRQTASMLPEAHLGCLHGPASSCQSI
jgi:hypothetical protein